MRHSPWSPLGYGHRRLAARASPGDGCHIVAREHARESGAQGRALEPAVPTLLQDTVCVALAQLQFVTLLGLVGVERQVPVGKRRVVSGAMDRRAPLHTWWAARDQKETPGKDPRSHGLHTLHQPAG